MRLLYRLNNNKWVQLFTDSALDKFANLSDLPDKKAARKNIGLTDLYWSKEQLRNAAGDSEDSESAENAINTRCINEIDEAQFVTKEQKAFWNQKVDKPKFDGVNAEGNPFSEATSGQLIYDSTTDNLLVALSNNAETTNIKRDPDNYRFTTGSGTFASNSKFATITHNCKKTNGAAVTPIFVSVMPSSAPNGYIGEYWVQNIGTSTFQVGNTGSGTSSFIWTALYKL